MPALPDPTKRFSARVADYDRGRPGYPAALFETIVDLAHLTPGAEVADIGAGTGISSAPLVDSGFQVRAVEPNAAMRQAAVERLGERADFTIGDGRAERTGLPDDSVDLVLAAQAFHWFDPGPTRVEWRRILRSGGSVALVWNDRRVTGTPVAREYEALLQRFGTDYREVDHRAVDRARLDAFFGGPYEVRHFPNAQVLDRAGLRARLLSSSYVPAVGQPGHEPMMAALEGLFEEHQRDGRVRIEYDVGLFLGPLA